MQGISVFPVHVDLQQSVFWSLTKNYFDNDMTIQTALWFRNTLVEPDFAEAILKTPLPILCLYFLLRFNSLMRFKERN